MTKLSKRNKLTIVIVAMLILLAIFLRNMWEFLPTNDIRGMIYIGLFVAWGFSVRQRIIQVQARRYLTAISGLMVFWVVIRSLKFQFPMSIDFVRYCWYFYYFPMLFIPTLGLLVSLSLGKSEDYRLPQWTNAIFLISSLLFAFVLTNDLHQLVFGFPKGLQFIENSDYTHNIVYFICLVWIAACSFVGLFVMISKCRIPGRRNPIWIPFVPIVLLIVYAVLYLTAWDFIKPIAGDMTIVVCLLVTATLEGCIQGRLIQSNSHYEELFRRSKVRAQIFDHNGDLILCSDGTEPLPNDMIHKLENGPLMVDGNVRLSSAPIKGGYVIWGEDVSELTAVLQELAEKQDDLEEENSILRENYNTELRIQQLAEKNRLYDKIHLQTAKQINLLASLLSQFEKEKDEAQRKRILQKMIVIGVYLKRRNNLIFISEQNQMMNVSELTLCFNETMDNLKLSGIECGCYISLKYDLPSSIAMSFYDFYEKVIEVAYDDLKAVLIRIYENDDDFRISLDICSDTNLLDLKSDNVSVLQDEPGVYRLIMSVSKEGEQ